MKARFHARSWLTAVLLLVFAQGLLAVLFLRHLGALDSGSPGYTWGRPVAVASASLTGLIVLVLLWLHYRMSYSLRHPILLMQRILDRAAQGELHLRLPLGPDRLLSGLSRSCNRLLESLQTVTEEGRRRAQVERDVSEALVESFPRPTLVLSPGGDVMSANLAARSILAGSEGGEALRGLTRCVLEGEESVMIGGERYAVEVKAVSHAAGLAGSVVHFQVA
ncbi:MAG: hypothetical protein HN742_02275 [Lentisphaerae bacterium]|jgi:nitrogen fixation/metabolism regulation signal transduction histidine kinase|nr:hypothetical protein [Lentisphaerota bacterium]MBT4818408.1 hypothetical protein [Lentisphaerota bacterium]MBT5610686.1 hypothetical protein [Lentisphaerota bacterium]MBT7058042.1 hypothetical protein [Lentisphaerota bacterium]MBT7840664.1 hypothetical protein [Lentisphaerota bacterium]